MIKPKYKFFWEHELKENEDVEEERKVLRAKAGLALGEVSKDEQFNLVGFYEGSKRFNENTNWILTLDVYVYDVGEYFEDYVNMRLFGKYSE